MKKIRLVLGIFILFLINFILGVNAATTISFCGQDINSSGTYLLNQSITSTSTCLTTNSSNVEIDCAGNTITYGTAGTANSIGIRALHATSSQVNLTIKNCILIKTSTVGAGCNGIMLTRFTNSSIFNNTITTNGVNGNKGIYILTGAAGNNISRNTIVTSGSSTTNYGIYLAPGTSDSLVEYNNVTTGKGTATTDNYGIRVDDPRANITSNIVYTFGSGDSNHGIYSYTSTSARIVNNIVYTSGTTGNNRGIYVNTADFNYIANNTINTTGQASPGIYLSASNSPNILNNKINSTADSIYMTSSVLSDFNSANISRDNTRFGRNITVYGGGATNLPCPNNTVMDNPSEGGLKFFGCNNVTVQNWYRPNRDTDGLLFVNSDNNKILNNTLNGGLEGLDMVNTAGMCDNNLIANNTFLSFGYLDSYGAYAIHIYGNNNTITNNNLSTSGITSGNIGINIQNDFNNITNNIISTNGTSGNYGINLESRAINNLIQNNIITTSGTSGNTGIYFVDECTGNIVRNNTITATGTTSGNLGMRLVSTSNNNLIEYNTFYTKGLTISNSGLELSSSSNNIFNFNNVYAGYGAGTTDNDAISLVGSSRNNTFMNNILFANGTSTSITSDSIFLQSNSANNTFINNIIIKSVGHAIQLDMLSSDYPNRNTFQNNSLNNVSGSDLFFLDTGINDTKLINQQIGKYNFTGAGGIISVENTQFGKIVFLSAVNGSNGNLSDDIQIKYNSAQVSSLKPGLNKTANITLYNLPTNFIRPTILKDGVACSNCENFTSLNARNVTFMVLSSSNYSIAEYPNLNPPVISSLSLTTTNPLTNNTDQNLTALWTASDVDNYALINITDWRVNGNSFAVLNMPFEAGSSNSTYTKDYSTYGNNGNVSGATLNSTGGYLGGGYFFNSDDTILINNGFDYSLGAITFWINEKASATANTMGIFSKLGNSLYTSDLVTATLSTTVANSALLGFGVYNNNNAAYAWRYDSLNFYNTGWHHVAIQANSSGNEVYIDGQKVSPTYTSGSSLSTGWLDYPAGNTDFRLGCRMGGLSCLYMLDNATIDDFRIYNRTLSSQQISAIYQNRTDLIVSKELSVGQNWSYCLTVSDGTNVSSTNCSNTVRIQSTFPTLTIISPLNTTYINRTQLINLSATNQQSIWFYNGSANVSYTTPVYLTFNEGSNTLIAYVNNSYGDLTSTNITFFIDTISPYVNIISPLNTTYNNLTQLINISSDGDYKWFTNSSGQNVSYTTPVYRTFTEGENTLIVYSNDSFGNTNFSVVVFLVDTTAPIIDMTLPSEGSVFGYDQNIQLNFSVFDSGNNLDSCWYNIDSGNNITIPNCQNTTFDSSNGPHVVYIYSNDTLGNKATDSVSFSIDVGAPTLLLNFPMDVYLNYNNISFRYSVIDIDLAACELWGDFDGTFKLNQTNNSPISGIENVFSLNLGDGIYLWNIRCNDSQGNSNFNGNKTFYVDTTSSIISLTQPIGTQSSRTVSASWSISDISPVSCKYNVYRGESLEISNTNVDCALGSTIFDVTVDANFMFNFYVNDSAGNINTASSSFSVDISAPVTPPPGDSEGSSGGGSGGIITNQTVILNLEITPIEVVLYPGEEKFLEVSVKNRGLRSVNKCKLRVDDQYKSWITSDKISNIAAGEIVEFPFSLNAFQEVDKLNLYLECLEGNKSVPLKINLVKSSININLLGISLDEENKVHIKYTVESKKDITSNLVFSIYSNKDKIKEEKQEVSLLEGKLAEYEMIIDLGGVDPGLLKVAISIEGEDTPLVEDSILYSETLVSGFAVNTLVGEGNISYIALIVFVFLVLAVIIIIRTIRDVKNKSKKEGNRKEGIKMIDGKVLERKHLKGKWIKLKVDKKKKHH